MPEAFPKPAFSFRFGVGSEVEHVRAWRDNKRGRQLPARGEGQLLVGSWNIANLGGQDRQPAHYPLLAEIVSWFDVCAIQEVKDDLRGLRGLLWALNKDHGTWKTVFTDRAGNEERLAVVYDSDVLELAEKIAELAIPQAEHDRIKLPGIDVAFGDFDRHPRSSPCGAPVATTSSSWSTCTCTSVPRRPPPSGSTRCSAAGSKPSPSGTGATAATATPTPTPGSSPPSGTSTCPRHDPAEALYATLTDLGLLLPGHSAKIAGSSISVDADYDQVAFLPGPMADRYLASGVFDYDGAVFPTLWNRRRQLSGERKGRSEFVAYLRYYMSDHRPIWTQFSSLIALPLSAPPTDFCVPKRDRPPDHDRARPSTAGRPAGRPAATRPDGRRPRDGRAIDGVATLRVRSVVSWPYQGLRRPGDGRSVWLGVTDGPRDSPLHRARVGRGARPRVRRALTPRQEPVASWSAPGAGRIDPSSRV